MSSIDVFTDGSCKGPQTKRRAAASVWVPSTKKGYVSLVPGRQTNQRAELFAILVTLDMVPGKLRILTDSDYTIKCLTVWWKSWVKNGWKNSKGKSVENQDLIKDLLELLKSRTIEFVHVYGHQKVSNYEADGNTKADELAQSFADGYISSKVLEVSYNDSGKKVEDDPWDAL